MPVNTLIAIPRRWEPVVTEVLMVGAMILCKAPSNAGILCSGSEMSMPFLMAMVVECRSTADDVAVQYWVPQLAPVSRLGGAKNKMVFDLFGEWVPFDTMTISDARLVNFPDIVVRKNNILEVFTCHGPGSIPYTVLDKLRVEHGIDVTSISLSQTHLGGLYRAHVLTTCR